MKWGFDLDGTLDHEEIRNLANFLIGHGEEVHVITACFPGDSYTPDQKAAKLLRLGVRGATLHIAWGEDMKDAGYAKAQILRREQIPIMFDDDATFCSQMAAYSTSRILMVVR